MLWRGLDGRTVTAPAGTFLQVPRRTSHAFRNNSATRVRLLILCAPAGFEKLVAEFSELPSRESPAPPVTGEEIAKVMALVPKYGMEILPQPS